MITLELYSFTGRPSTRNNLYIAYFRSDVELQDMLGRILSEAHFNRTQGHYILQATNIESTSYYYTDRPTVTMHRLLSDYKKVFKRAYEIAEMKTWSFAWQAAGEAYRINCALMNMESARQKIIVEKWEG